MNRLNIQLKVNTCFKIIMVLMILVSFFIVLSFDYNVAYFSYFNSLNLSVYSTYSIITLFLSMLYFTIDTIHNFDIKYMQIIRYKDYKEYINKLIIKVSVNNFLVFMIYIILLMILFYFRFISIHISDYLYYPISDVCYFIFNVIKMYLIINAIILIITLLIKYTKNIYSYILLIGLIIENILFTNNNSTITLENIIWTPSQFLEQYIFESFKLEITCNLLFIVFILSIFFIIKKILSKSRMDIG